MYLYEILKTTADMLAEKDTEAAKKVAEFADSGRDRKERKMKYAVINNEGHVSAHDCDYQTAEDVLNYELEQDQTNAEEWEIIEE